MYAPSIDIQVAIISPKSRDLGRCNTPAFTPVFGLLFSREAEPSAQCTSMWKGGVNNDAEPSHIVTETYAEFPWGSCVKLRDRLLVQAYCHDPRRPSDPLKAS